MPFIKKDQAGSDSHGHTWPEDGAVVEVAPEHAQALLAIPDGGFSEVAPPTREMSEVAPDPEPDASPAPRRGGRPRKTPPAGE